MTSHKFVQQLLVAQLLNKKLVYSSYKNKAELAQYREILSLISNRSVSFGMLLNHMCSHRGGDYFAQLKKLLLECKPKE